MDIGEKTEEKLVRSKVDPGLDGWKKNMTTIVERLSNK